MDMETTHRIEVADSRQLDSIPSDSVDIVVTSPPYPMIEMWDEVFARLDPSIARALEDEDGPRAFSLMHDVLSSTWEEVARVLVEGGMACINVGDATRSVDGEYRLYHNHATIVDTFESLGLTPLPDILWRKPTNSTAKFMGSGMVPPNAYPTLEHEFILLFRNGPTPRSFEAGDECRYASAYFWEERNDWFSDVWTDVGGEHQHLGEAAQRDRSGAFPPAIPYRLVNMFSVYGDTVLDPFWGTGTTTVAAMLAGRNSIGYELDRSLRAAFDDRLDDLPVRSHELVTDRIERHRAFVEQHRKAGGEVSYQASRYDFPVKTRQERDIEFRVVEEISEMSAGYRVTHRRF